MKIGIIGSLLALLAAIFVVTGAPARAATVHYVSDVAPVCTSGCDGSSWATAWPSFSAINWSSVAPGDSIEIDGGSSTCPNSPYDFTTDGNPGVNCGQSYKAPLTVGVNGVTIERSTAAGHNGTVVINGGRTTKLPYCGQASYSAANGSALGFDFNGHNNVSLLGHTRSGIVVRGAQNGIRFHGGSGDTVSDVEAFDNGYPVSHSGYVSTDGNGILLGGTNDTITLSLIHDNGQDAVHSDASGNGFDESGDVFTNDFLGSLRSLPNVGWEPWNDDQVSGGHSCTHADGVQLFAPATTMQGPFTVDHVMCFGVNQCLYPSDGGTGTTMENVSASNDLFAAVSHGIITDNPVHGWSLSNLTLWQPSGGEEVPGDGSSSLTNTLKRGGYWFDTGTTWTASGNRYNGGDPLPGGTSGSLGFASPPAISGGHSTIAAIRGADFTSPLGGAQDYGSFAGLMARIDSLSS